MSLGKTLAELRKKAGLTQSELGQKLNISAQAISKWENSISEPDFATIRKLAEIYNVSVSYIIDNENVNNSEDNGTAPTAEASTGEEIYASLYDVYISEIDKDKKIKVISYLMNMMKLQLYEAKGAVENLPYCISGMVDGETAEKIKDYFAAVGASVTLLSSSGREARKEIASLTPPKPIKETKNMKKRFVISNITAAIPAIALTVFLILASRIFSDYLIAVYLGICTYTFIFLLWYPTLTRKLLAPIRALRFEGFFGSIGGVVLFILFIPWLLLVALISPINYAFAIKTRVRRMLDEDDDDDIFTVEYIASL